MTTYTRDGRAWAYLGAALGSLVSIGANTAHSYLSPSGARDTATSLAQASRQRRRSGAEDTKRVAGRPRVTGLMTRWSYRRSSSPMVGLSDEVVYARHHG